VKAEYEKKMKNVLKIKKCPESSLVIFMTAKPMRLKKNAGNQFDILKKMMTINSTY